MFDGIKEDKKAGPRPSPDQGGEQGGYAPDNRLTSREKKIIADNPSSSPPSRTPAAGASSDIDQRIKELYEKGRRWGKRYSWIGISLSLLISISALYFGYRLWNEVTDLNRRLEQSQHSIIIKSYDPDNICQEDSCCLASLQKIRKGGFEMKSGPDGNCPPAFKANSLLCETSLSWCEPVAATRPLIPSEPLEKDRTVLSRDLSLLIGLPRDYETAEAVDRYGKSGFAVYPPEEYFKAQENQNEPEVFPLFISTGPLNDSVIDFELNRVRVDNESLEIEYRNIFSATSTIAHNVNNYVVDMAFIPRARHNDTLVITNYHSRELFDFIIDNLEFVIDSDQDGLFDFEESEYGTDKDDADTDDDGFLDGDEIDSGYNPLGEGLLELPE